MSVDEIDRPAGDQRAPLRRELSRFDTVFFLISAMVVLDTIGAIAIGGGEVLTWLVVLFFVPSALISAELGAAIPEQGGAYVWVRMAFGRVAGGPTALPYWAGTPLWLGGSLAVVAMSAYEGFIADLDSRAGTRSAPCSSRWQPSRRCCRCAAESGCRPAARSGPDRPAAPVHRERRRLRDHARAARDRRGGPRAVARGLHRGRSGADLLLRRRRAADDGGGGDARSDPRHPGRRRARRHRAGAHVRHSDRSRARRACDRTDHLAARSGGRDENGLHRLRRQGRGGRFGHPRRRRSLAGPGGRRPVHLGARRQRLGVDHGSGTRPGRRLSGRRRTARARSDLGTLGRPGGDRPGLGRRPASRAERRAHGS